MKLNLAVALIEDYERHIKEPKELETLYTTPVRGDKWNYRNLKGFILARSI